MFIYMTFMLLYRLLVRAGKIAAQSGIPKAVKHVYDDVLALHATAYCKAHDAVIAAESALRAARRKLGKDLLVFESPYRAARAVVLAYFPDQLLPETLGVQRTNTDIEIAVTALSSLVQSHASESWAAELQNGPFGTHAPKVLESLEEVDATSTALAEVRQERANAKKAAREGLVVFRRVVRDTLGATSPQYRQLRIPSRSMPTVDDDEETAPESGVIPSAKGETAPQTSEPISVKDVG
jgi:hypothetical protein